MRCCASFVIEAQACPGLYIEGMSTVAIHAIWTTYMTWPPGDPRGHWSPLFDFYGKLIAQGRQLNLPDSVTAKYAESLAKEPQRILASHDQQIVADTIGGVLRVDLEGRIAAYAGAIERAHTHLLLGEVHLPINDVIGRIKSRTSSAVIKHGTEPRRTRTWTSGYWKVSVFDITAVPDIQRYIEHHNTERGLAAAPHHWITPFI
jgi:hypothetical protein